MCGITGIFGNFSPSGLSAMNTVIAHRGPDDQGIWHDPSNRIGLAHRRLSIIDVSPAGSQPMWDTSKKVVIVYNGEIYNYRELASELRRDGFTFSNQSDTEVILNLYLRDGSKCLEKLNGIFAFALWDTRTQELLVARDGPGVKPLYYYAGGAGFAFASELKALCCLPQIERRLDCVALQHYLTYLYCPSPRTPLQDVKKLEPGSALIVRDGRIVKSWRFWELPVLPSLTGYDIPELQEQLEVLFSRAVERQMISDVPVGAFLSGGLDSTAIVSFARSFTNGHKLDCFTIGQRDSMISKEGFAEDLPYARRAAAHLDVPLHEVWTDSGMAGGFEEMVYQMDEPQPDPAALNVLQIARLSQSKGIKVLLSGAGGDDLFSGYRRHRALGLERYWAWAPRSTRRMIQNLSGRLPKHSPVGRRIAKAFQFAGESTDRRMAGYFSWLAPEITSGLFSQGSKENIQSSDPLAPMIDALESLPSGTEPLNRMLHLEQRFFLPDHNLNYTDKLAMAAGVEVRVPFLDHDLMAFAAALPTELKQRGPTGKWLLKKAMEAHLPREIIYRPKTGFGAPLRQWMQGELRDHFEHALAPATIQARGVFDSRAVSELVAADRAGKIDAAYPLFGIVCIETWCRLFLDKTPKY